MASLLIVDGSVIVQKLPDSVHPKARPNLCEGAALRTWAACFFFCLLVASLGACQVQGPVTLKLVSATSKTMDKVSTLSFHFRGSGLKEVPKPVKVSVSDGKASLPSLLIKEKARDPWFDASVFGLDDSGKVVAFGGLRLPLVSKPFTYSVFFSNVESFVRLSNIAVPEDTSFHLLPEGLIGHRVVALKDGRFLIVGGATKVHESKGLLECAGPNFMVKNLILYDPTTGVFEIGLQLALPRAFHTATLLPDGRVLIAGGLGYINNKLSVIALSEIYDPKDESLVAASRMVGPRAFHTATLLSDGSVLFVGGVAKPLLSLKEVDRAGHQVLALETFRADVRTGPQKVGSLATDYGRFLHQTVALSENELLVHGGLKIDKAGKQVLAGPVLKLSRIGDQWRAKPLNNASHKPRYEHSLVAVKIQDKTWAVALGGRGEGNRPVADIEIWGTDEQMFSGGKLKTPRYGQTAVYMANQKILVAGGLDATGTPASEGEVFAASNAGGKLSLKLENVTPRLQSNKGRYLPVMVTAPFDPRIYLVGGGEYRGPGTVTDSRFYQGLNTAEIYTPALSLPSDE